MVLGCTFQGQKVVFKDLLHLLENRWHIYVWSGVWLSLRVTFRLLWFF